MRRVFFAFAYFGFALSSQAADVNQICIYTSEQGKVSQVNGRSNVPEKYRAGAKCFVAERGNYLAKPEDIELDGTLRRENISTSLGRMNMRWPRKVETLFGRTPQRAMAEAASAASRALKQGGFSPEVQSLNLDFEAVFMDEDLPDTQIPKYLVSNCHPAWMTPPSNLYVVAQRVVAGCGQNRPPDRSVADAELAQVLIHELGHVIEHQLLKSPAQNDRARAEGFACWFEQYASEYSPLIRKGSVRKFYFDLAKQALRGGGTGKFGGSAQDYASASMYFNAIVERRGVRGLMSVYQEMNEKKIDFMSAALEVTGWSQKKFAQEIAGLLK